MILPRRVLAIGLLLAFGAARLPFEVHLEKQSLDLQIKAARLSMEVREEVSQLSFIAALSGFRSFVAACLWIEAHSAWERTQWGRMAGLFNTVTTLQPRSLLYWDLASWHMAWNASIAALQDEKQPSEALRVRAQRQYFQLGRDFLERGIQNNPDRYQLYEKLAVLLRDKLEDPCASAAAFDKAASFPDAPPYLKRFAAYELAQCPGREREAYDRMKEIFAKGVHERMPTLLSKIREFEETLQIPEDQRLKMEPPQ